MIEPSSLLTFTIRAAGVRRSSGSIALVTATTLATYIIGDLSGYPEADRNMLRWIFRLPASEVPWADEEAVRFARTTVADLRAAYARYPTDPGLRKLVAELLALSPNFAEMWSAHEVESRGPLMKRFDHPLAGP